MIEPREDAWPKNGSGSTTGVRPEPIPDTIAQPPPSREHLRQLIFAPGTKERPVATERS